MALAAAESTAIRVLTRPLAAVPLAHALSDSARNAQVHAREAQVGHALRRASPVKRTDFGIILYRTVGATKLHRIGGAEHH